VYGPFLTFFREWSAKVWRVAGLCRRNPGIFCPHKPTEDFRTALSRDLERHTGEALHQALKVVGILVYIFWGTLFELR